MREALLRMRAICTTAVYSLFMRLYIVQGFGYRSSLEPSRKIGANTREKERTRDVIDDTDDVSSDRERNAGEMLLPNTPSLPRDEASRSSI